MKVTNEQPEETPRLTVADLGVAAWATSELFNYMLEGYEAEEYGAMTKEQMEQSMNTLRTAFVKFDTLVQALNQNNENNETSEN
jgi:hypothetical protein|tara:strand:- start:180 stop:431 length:252 start_codon:yes stop_codon:yes gene_type:complete